MSSFPVDAIIPRLKSTFLKNPSAVLNAPPGSGKTTRVPLALLGVIPPERGRIIILEPRRIAAVSAAKWMAGTIGEEVGETVGYSIRFDSKISQRTRIEVVTEGVLIRRIQNDPGLEGVAMVIFDEFHERSLSADLALALCLDLRREIRHDLQILVMSATLDCGPIASLLGGAPVLSLEGKPYFVEERYLPSEGKPLPASVVRGVLRALRETSGDILVFLPGGGEIRACEEALRPEVSGMASLHLLYGDLPFEEQEKAILPAPGRKIVLSTNIAETSLTIEGVGVVIDSGLTRRLRHDPATGMDRMITVPVSKASAEQRKGRAGRTGPGVCYRLFSPAHFQALASFSPPEMTVSDLSSLALELAAWGVKDPRKLQWLDFPPEAAWQSALVLLKELGALDQSGSVTSEGRSMALLPLHPRLARLFLKARKLACLRLGADLAALLSERDVLRSSPDRARRLSDPDIGERVDLLTAWRKGETGAGMADRWALRSVDRVAGQLVSLVYKGAEAPQESGSSSDLISGLLLSAFPGRVARRREEGGGRFVLEQGRGVRLPSESRLARDPYLVVVRVDASGKAEDFVRLAASLSEEVIRRECGDRIKTMRKVEWDKREGRIISVEEERLGAVLLSASPISPADEEVGPVLCAAIRSNPGMLKFTHEARQLQGRVLLVRKTFPGEEWPDFSNDLLLSSVGEWLLPWLDGVRNVRDIAGLDVLPALRARLTRQQLMQLDERAPAGISVPSGRRVRLDYSSGETPVLSVKLQEMFGLADTPSVAAGRVKVLLHLLSPAGRPVQVTQDLKGFWNTGYQQVKRELKGRYPKHPWPDDPWSAAPTRRTKRRDIVPG